MGVRVIIIFFLLVSFIDSSGCRSNSAQRCNMIRTCTVLYIVIRHLHICKFLPPFENENNHSSVKDQKEEEIDEICANTQLSLGAHLPITHWHIAYHCVQSGIDYPQQQKSATT